ncbi:MAG: hypothetical protein ACRBF0_06915 [Calditrichia bacterium]
MKRQIILQYRLVFFLLLLGGLIWGCSQQTDHESAANIMDPHSGSGNTTNWDEGVDANTKGGQPIYVLTTNRGPFEIEYKAEPYNGPGQLELTLVAGDHQFGPPGFVIIWGTKPLPMPLHIRHRFEADYTQEPGWPSAVHLEWEFTKYIYTTTSKTGDKVNFVYYDQFPQFRVTLNAYEYAGGPLLGTYPIYFEEF